MRDLHDPPPLPSSLFRLDQWWRCWKWSRQTDSPLWMRLWRKGGRVALWGGFVCGLIILALDWRYGLNFWMSSIRGKAFLACEVLSPGLAAFAATSFCMKNLWEGDPTLRLLPVLPESRISMLGLLSLKGGFAFSFVYMAVFPGVTMVVYYLTQFDRPFDASIAVATLRTIYDLPEVLFRSFGVGLFCTVSILSVSCLDLFRSSFRAIFLCPIVAAMPFLVNLAIEELVFPLPDLIRYILGIYDLRPHPRDPDHETGFMLYYELSYLRDLTRYNLTRFLFKSLLILALVDILLYRPALRRARFRLFQTED